jgi:hypothetical protein
VDTPEDAAENGYGDYYDQDPAHEAFPVGRRFMLVGLNLLVEAIEHGRYLL